MFSGKKEDPKLDKSEVIYVNFINAVVNIIRNNTEAKKVKMAVDKSPMDIAQVFYTKDGFDKEISRLHLELYGGVSSKLIEKWLGIAVSKSCYEEEHFDKLISTLCLPAYVRHGKAGKELMSGRLKDNPEFIVIRAMQLIEVEW